jgi:EAL domain-containing protein (putative c-di-GMP-specific phosphodiesterase class I)
MWRLASLGAEALARWQSASGPVNPEVFSRLAERSGLIEQLGLSVLRQSIQTAVDWPDIKLSVNVSLLQICNPSFADGVSRLLMEQNFEPA